jgi:ribosomal protein L12E/L44/L45/RPP1/RPP2
VVSSVQVNLSDVLRLSRSINATVMGSKDAEGAKEAAEGEANDHSEEEEEEPTEHSAAVEM